MYDDFAYICGDVKHTPRWPAAARAEGTGRGNWQRELAANANLMRKILKSTPLSGLKGANVAAAAAAAVAVVLQLQQVAASGNVQMTSFKFMHDPHSNSSSISCQQQQRCSVVVVELMFY